jgi:sRNA-binding carbon storage regulator CsrA
MLCISRTPGEACYVGDAIVEIVRIQGKRVTLGITANRDVPILRTELRGSNDKTMADPEGSTFGAS